MLWKTATSFLRYCIETLLLFWRSSNKLKNNMEVYTNAMLVKELITNQTEIGVCPLNQHVPESKEVDLFLFDDHL